MTSTSSKPFLKNYSNFTNINIDQKCSEYKNLNKEMYDHVFAIGDIHGDYNAIISILIGINCIISRSSNQKFNEKDDIDDINNII